MNKKVIEAENRVLDYLDKKFPKGKDKRRGEVLVIIALAKEMGVVGAWDKAKEKYLKLIDAHLGYWGKESDDVISLGIKAELERLKECVLGGKDE